MNPGGLFFPQRKKPFNAVTNIEKSCQPANKPLHGVISEIERRCPESVIYRHTAPPLPELPPFYWFTVIRIRTGERFFSETILTALHRFDWIRFAGSLPFSAYPPCKAGYSQFY